MTTQQIDLTVTANRNGGGKFDHWTMSGGTNCQVPAQCAVTVSSGNNANVSITIADPSGPQSGPTQVTFGTPGIDVPGSGKNEIHHVGGVGTTQLTFRDHNWNQGSLKYTLNFNNAPPIDPILNNGGGGPPMRSSAEYLPQTTTAFVAELAVALLIGLIIGLIIGRRSR